MKSSNRKVKMIMINNQTINNRMKKSNKRKNASEFFKTSTLPSKKATLP